MGPRVLLPEPLGTRSGWLRTRRSLPPPCPTTCSSTRLWAPALLCIELKGFHADQGKTYDQTWQQHTTDFIWGTL